MVVGAAITVATGLFLMGAASDRFGNVDWYTLKPTGYVLDDLTSTNSIQSDRAWRELTRRQKNGAKLSPRHHDRLTEIALAEQAATKPGTSRVRELIEWLGDETLAGRLSDAQKQRFLEQTIRLTLTVRPTVIEGDYAPYRVSHEGRGPTGDIMKWWNRIDRISASVDGGPPFEQGTGGSFAGVGSGGSVGGAVPVKGIGRHELKVTVRIEVWSGPQAAIPSTDTNTLQHSRDITLKGTLEIVPDAAAHRIQHQAPDPAAEAALRAALKPDKFEYETTPRRALSGIFDLKSLPVDISFEVAARVGEKEYSLGTVTYAAGGTTQYYVRGDYDGPSAPTTIDLVLRPDEKAARRTVDLVRIWDGTLEFKSVPVQAAKR
jgi:hypothetical protein